MERNCLGRKNQADLAKRLEEVGSKERKQSKMTSIFLAKLSESHSEKGNIGELADKSSFWVKLS